MNIPNDTSLEGGFLSVCLADARPLFHERALAPDDFFLPVHQNIYRAMEANRDDGLDIDYLTVAARLKSEGDKQVLKTLSENTGAFAKNTETYMSQLRGFSTRRQCIEILENSISSFCDSDDAAGSYETLVENLISKGDEMAEDTDGGLVSYSEMSRKYKLRVNEVLDARELGDWTKIGFTTGNKRLDEMLGYLRRKMVTVIGGDTNTGKSAWALDVMYKNAIECRKRNVKFHALYFSFELSEEEVVERGLARESGVKISDISMMNYRGMDGYPNTAWNDVEVALDKLAELDIEVDDDGAGYVETMYRRALAAALKNPVDMIVIDYAQLASSKTLDVNNKEALVSAAVRTAKRLAKKLNCHVILVSQVKQEYVQRRPMQAPELHDLAWSSALEQHSQNVLMLWNPDNLRLEKSWEDFTQNLTHDELEEVEYQLVKKPEQALKKFKDNLWAGWVAMFVRKAKGRMGIEYFWWEPYKQAFFSTTDNERDFLNDNLFMPAHRNASANKNRRKNI